MRSFPDKKTTQTWHVVIRSRTKSDNKVRGTRHTYTGKVVYAEYIYLAWNDFCYGSCISAIKNAILFAHTKQFQNTFTFLCSG